MPGGVQVMGAEEGGQHLKRISQSMSFPRILNHCVGFSIHLKTPKVMLVESYADLPGVGTNICHLFVNISLSEEELA